MHDNLDAHARPPESMRLLFKYWRKCSITDVEASPEMIDGQSSSHPFLYENSRGGPGKKQSRKEHEKTMLEALGSMPAMLPSERLQYMNPMPDGFEVESMPGLYVFPSLLTPLVQVALLEKLLHRDLSNPVHKTNVHLHYNVPSAAQCHTLDDPPPRPSYFAANPETIILPKDPDMHKPITIKQFLDGKLRWVTLGGQYDWTNKVYPNEPPPLFPSDIAAFLQRLFPEVDSQAAIVNFYSPGDTLSVHRDVSEECSRGLISASIGCDAIFITGNEDGSKTSTIRLRSGDVVLMSGESRFAWHAVPKILAGTCPSWLQAWPSSSESDDYDYWKGWMSNKRINLNVRQMRES